MSLQGIWLLPPLSDIRRTGCPTSGEPPVRHQRNPQSLTRPDLGATPALSSHSITHAAAPAYPPRAQRSITRHEHAARRHGSLRTRPPFHKPATSAAARAGTYRSPSHPPHHTLDQSPFKHTRSHSRIPPRAQRSVTRHEHSTRRHGSLRTCPPFHKPATSAAARAGTRRWLSQTPHPPARSTLDQSPFKHTRSRSRIPSPRTAFSHTPRTRHSPAREPPHSPALPQASHPHCRTRRRTPVAIPHAAPSHPPDHTPGHARPSTIR